MITEKIIWSYFFGGGRIPNQEHYYKAEINGIRVEKHTFRGGVEYSIGNMDEAEIKYSSEDDLILALNSSRQEIDCLKCMSGMPCPFCNGTGKLIITDKK